MRYVRMQARNVDTTLLEDATRRGEYTVDLADDQRPRRERSRSCMYITVSKSADRQAFIGREEKRLSDTYTIATEPISERLSSVLS